MSFLSRRGQDERRSESCREGFRAVALDRQAAAFFGAIQREGRDDDCRSGKRGGLQDRDICGLPIRSREEVKCGAVVPDLELYESEPRDRATGRAQEGRDRVYERDRS